jgi:hypothetical protein
LNSTGNYPEIRLYRDNPYTPEVLPGSNLLTLENWNESTTEEADFDQTYLPEGIYYLRADSLGSYNLSSWDLQISKTTLPIVADGTTTVSVDNEVPGSQDGTITLKQGIMVRNITLGELFDVSVTCPDGYNITNPINQTYHRGENKTESGVIMFMENKVPTLFKQNGKDYINNFPTIYGVDQDTEDKKHTERSYNTYPSPITYDMNITQYGIDAMFWVWLQNVSVNVGDISFDFTFESSTNQPETLNPGDKTFNFNHLSANDDEGIYKLNSSVAVGSVMEFKMKSMDNYAQTDMSFISNLYNPIYGGDLGYIEENSIDSNVDIGGNPTMEGHPAGIDHDEEIVYKEAFSWNNDTYSDHIKGNYYDTLPTEIAILSDTWCILQDTQDRGYPDENTTSFTLNLANKSSYSLQEQFNKQRGTDLVLIEAELPSGSNIHLEELNGIIQEQTIDITADVYSDGSYWFSDTSDYKNIPMKNYLFLISKDGSMYDSEYLRNSTDISVTTGRSTSKYYLVLRLPTTFGVRNQSLVGGNVQEYFDFWDNYYDEDITSIVIMEPEAPQANIGTFKVTATFFETEEETGGFEIPGYPFFITLSVSVFFIGIIAYISRKKRFGS